MLLADTVPLMLCNPDDGEGEKLYPGSPDVGAREIGLHPRRLR